MELLEDLHGVLTRLLSEEGVADVVHLLLGEPVSFPFDFKGRGVGAQSFYQDIGIAREFIEPVFGNIGKAGEELFGLEEFTIVVGWKEGVEAIGEGAEFLEGLVEILREFVFIDGGHKVVVLIGVGFVEEGLQFVGAFFDRALRANWR